MWLRPRSVSSDNVDTGEKQTDHEAKVSDGEESSVSLPPPCGEDDWYDDHGRACGCKQKCIAKFDAMQHELCEWQCHRQMMKDVEVSQVVFHMLLTAKRCGQRGVNREV